MHICLITNEYPKTGFAHGGIGSFIKTLAPKLVQKGVKVTVIGLTDENSDDYEEDRGVKIYRLTYKKIKYLSWYTGVKVIRQKIIKINKFDPIDIVETSELGLFCIKKINTIRYIIRLHGGHHFFAEAENRKINFWKGFQEKKSFKNADGFIAISNYVKSHTEKYLSFHNKPIAYINNLIDTDYFSPLDLPIKRYSIVFIGSICEKKGIRQLIQAFPLVKEKFPDATLEIYGREWFYPDGKSYTKMLLECELPKLNFFANDVHFHGLVDYDKIPEKYAQAHICVFPSHMETQGLVAPEAMAMEKVVVFTNKGPGPETINEYENGLLCDPLYPKDIAEKIIWSFSNEKESKAISVKARQSVLEKYSPTIIVQKNIDFYKSIIKR